MTATCSACRQPFEETVRGPRGILQLMAHHDGQCLTCYPCPHMGWIRERDLATDELVTTCLYCGIRREATT